MGRQFGFKFRTWGGKRKDAGRKPSGPHAGASHLRRPQLPPRTPVHVTVRMLPHVWNLRSRRSFAHIGKAILAAAERYAMRLAEFSIQGNHIHLIVEATDQAALAQGMKGLGVRVARGLNTLMGRHGQVIAERYHAHVLRTPTEVHNAVHYVLHNYRRHFGAPTSFVDPYSSAGLPLPRPHTWPLRDIGSHAAENDRRYS